jgi:hypothetical protein
MDFNTFVDLQVLQTSAHGRVGNARIARDVLHSRIGNARVIFEEGGQAAAGDITALVNRCRKDRTAVLTKPYRIIRSPAKK